MLNSSMLVVPAATNMGHWLNPASSLVRVARRAIVCAADVMATTFGES